MKPTEEQQAILDADGRVLDGELAINKRAALELIMRDKRIETVDINVATFCDYFDYPTDCVFGFSRNCVVAPRVFGLA